MDSRPLVSIITPTYNHQEFISACIDSVLAQTYVKWEQIIIDDGSSDRTGDIAYQYNDERIRYIRQNHRGIWHLGELYNEALRLSQGEYIAILEGDDFWPSHKLELQLKAHSGSSAVLSWGRAKIFDYQNRELAVLPEDIQQYRGISREEALGRLLFQNPMTSCTIICRRSALLSIGGFKQPQEVPYVDLPTWLELSLIGDFLAIDEVLGCYRMHAMQVSSSMKSSMIKASLYPIEFYNHLPLKIKESLAKRVSGFRTRLEKKKFEYHYYLGRAYLKEGRRSEARESFLRAISWGRSEIRMKAMLGLICSYCGRDLEWLAKLHNKAQVRDRDIDKR